MGAMLPMDCWGNFLSTNIIPRVWEIQITECCRARILVGQSSGFADSFFPKAQ